MTTYLITEVQISAIAHLTTYELTQMLQSLPMVDSEPVAWINKDSTYVELATKSTVYGSHTIPLYTSHQALTPITADDVTDEILCAFIEQSPYVLTGLSLNSELENAIAAAYNAVIKHRGEA